MPLPRWVEPQLSKLVEKAPTGPNWVHEIKFDGYRMAARIERGKVQLLTRSGLDWTESLRPRPPPSPSCR
jgi:bifunctional non-homologous end joining protein LigD